MRIPKGFLYSEDHIAVKKIKPGRVRLYLTEYIFSAADSDELTEISVEVEQGDEISAGDVIGQVVVSDYQFEIISPVSGSVTKVNTDLIESPDIIYGDGIYKEGWILEVDTTDNIESQLMTPDQYKEFLEEIGES